MTRRERKYTQNRHFKVLGSINGKTLLKLKVNHNTGTIIMPRGLSDGDLIIIRTYENA